MPYRVPGWDGGAMTTSLSMKYSSCICKRNSGASERNSGKIVGAVGGGVSSSVRSRVIFASSATVRGGAESTLRRLMTLLAGSDMISVVSLAMRLMR